MSKNQSNSTIIIIGGGPAGLFAAGTAANSGAKVVLLEKTKRCGNKLLITGSGKCNITNSAPLNEFLEHFPENSKFLYPAFTEFFTKDLEEFFNRFNVFFSEEEDGKIFPDSGKATSVLNALLSYCTEQKIDTRCNESVVGINCNTKQAFGWTVTTDKAEYLADKVIIATGGLSYPKTGSAGDGFRLASGLDHKIVATRPALVPLVISCPICRALSGVSLKDVEVTLWKNYSDPLKQKIIQKSGDLLFTHFGVSGPVILFLSRYIMDDSLSQNKSMNSPTRNEDDRSLTHYTLTVNILPGLSQQEIDSKLISSFERNPNKRLSNDLQSEFGLPQSFASELVNVLKLPENIVCNSITKDTRKAVYRSLTEFKLEVSGTRGYKEAMVTAGGISTKEINPKTMESKIHHGLYFAGEVIDIDGFTGGFNLQAAFSTGYLAGKSAARKLTADSNNS